MGIRIDDLVAPEAKAELTAFLATMESVKSKYVDICQSMVQGINVKVSVVGDVEKLDELIKVQSREMVTATNQMQTASNQLQTALGNTTNTISRQLAEQEKLNKTQREAYQLNQSALDIAKNILGTYDQNVAALARLNKEMKDNKDAYKNSTITADEFLRKELELKTAKAEVQRILNNETKMMQAADGSYKQLSLQLERMKMAYKQLNEEEKRAGQGKTLGAEIQKLDAHLKDAAADMGEFQRNVGNYAIAAMRAVGVNGKLGVPWVSTASWAARSPRLWPTLPTAAMPSLASPPRSRPSGRPPWHCCPIPTCLPSSASLVSLLAPNGGMTTTRGLSRRAVRQSSSPA